jgi:chromosome segregation ATPase
MNDKSTKVAGTAQKSTDISVSSCFIQKNSHSQKVNDGNMHIAKLEAKLYTELSEAHKKNIQLETKLEDQERKYRMQQEQISELKEQITHLQGEMKSKVSHFDKRLQQEKSRHRYKIKGAEQLRHKEAARVRQECKKTENTLRERIQHLETSRLELEEEISHLKVSSMVGKIRHEKQLSLAKQKIQANEENPYQQMEKLHASMTLSKEEIQSRCNQQSSTIRELQSQVFESDNAKKRIEECNTKLAEKSSITFSKDGKVRIELNLRPGEYYSL